MPELQEVEKIFKKIENDYIEAYKCIEVWSKLNDKLFIKNINQNAFGNIYEVIRNSVAERATQDWVCNPVLTFMSIGISRFRRK